MTWCGARWSTFCLSMGPPLAVSMGLLSVGPDVFGVGSMAADGTAGIRAITGLVATPQSVPAQRNPPSGLAGHRRRWRSHHHCARGGHTASPPHRAGDDGTRRTARVLLARRRDHSGNARPGGRTGTRASRPGAGAGGQPRLARPSARCQYPPPGRCGPRAGRKRRSQSPGGRGRRSSRSTTPPRSLAGDPMSS